MFWKRMFGAEKKQEQQQQQEEKAQRGFFQKLVSGLEKTKQGFVDKVEQIMTGRKVDEELFEELEEALIQADCGVETSLFLVDRLRERAKEEKITESEQLKDVLVEEIVELLQKNAASLKTPEERPYVLMVVGVNGAGKTTTIAKLAYRFKQEGARVLLAAGDTFRAGAIEQLEVWANRIGVELIKHQEGSDPAAVAYDAVNAAKARKSDVLILDTAGRLQTKVNLMSELSKVHRVVQRELGRDLDEILLVVDATTGQNALSQAKIFHEAVPLTGIALTKLDGTAKGGIVLALAHELELAVKLVGVGEQYEDLQDFDPNTFASALFGRQEKVLDND
ncbi:MAG: signal recognition particle-docking protein FtsY [Limnochordia bacterium]